MGSLFGLMWDWILVGKSASMRWFCQLMPTRITQLLCVGAKSVELIFMVQPLSIISFFIQEKNRLDIYECGKKERKRNDK